MTTKTDRHALISPRGRGDTRRLILSAAIAEFAEREFAKTTVESIAKRAGFGKGTVYLYFKNKADLFAAVVAEAMTDLLGVLKERGASFIDPIERLRDSLCYLTNFAMSYVPLMYSAKATLRLFDKSHMQMIVSARQNMLDFYADMIRDAKSRGTVRDVDETQVGRIIGSMIHSVLFTRTDHPSVLHNPKKHIDSFLDLLLNGILKK